jgi:ubiquinone/menaquinone biosynthesis C-methylase UbiE
MSTKVFKDKHYQTLEQLQVHYDIETALAKKLRNASKHERKELYTSVYDELYQQLPNNSMLIRKSKPQVSAWVVGQRMQLINHLLKPDSVFLEIGPGDCSLSFEVAKYAKTVYAVDVTEKFKEDLVWPQNCELVISDGSSIPVPDNSVDLAYSHQVMEHLHPDDALEQLQNVYKALAPGGVYICITPNRLSGPHDCSHYFDEVATGLHLKEYTVTELYTLFRRVGFSTVNYYKSYKQNHFKVPLVLPTLVLLKGLETGIGALPYSFRRNVAGTPLLFRGMTIVGTK